MVTKANKSKQSVAKALLTRIRKANAELAKSRKKDPAKARVLIAKDALALLEAKKLTARSGVYIQANAAMYEADDDADMQTEFRKPGSNCEVCALGSLFVANVDLNDRLSIYKGLDDRQEAMHNELAGIFSVGQLQLIEDYFECQRGVHGSDNSTRRLKWILNNIVDNDGTFLAPKSVLEALRDDVDNGYYEETSLSEFGLNADLEVSCYDKQGFPVDINGKRVQAGQ